MTDCRHQNLVLLAKPGSKFRCTHCHLTLDASEMAEGFCPECLHTKGLRHSDFEEITPDIGPKVQYRCEGCGIMVEID